MHAKNVQNMPKIAKFSKMSDNEIFEVLVTIFVTSFVYIFGMFTPNTLCFKRNQSFSFFIPTFWKYPI